MKKVAVNEIKDDLSKSLIWPKDSKSLFPEWKANGFLVGFALDDDGVD